MYVTSFDPYSWKPHATCKLHGSIFYGTIVIADRSVLHSGNMDVRLLCCCDLDFYIRTYPHSFKMYRMPKMNVLHQGFWKLSYDKQTDRQTDRHTYISKLLPRRSRVLITVCDLEDSTAYCIVCWCSMVGLRRVESGWFGRSDVAHEAAARRTDSQQGRTGAAAQQTDAGELRLPTSDSRPWSQPRFVQQKQVASPAEAGEHAVETGRRSQSKKSINRTVRNIWSAYAYLVLVALFWDYLARFEPRWPWSWSPDLTVTFQLTVVNFLNLSFLFYRLTEWQTKYIST